MSLLFMPFEMKGIILRNRIVMSPMCMHSSTNQDGYATDWHRVHYASRSVGGAGLIILESTAVNPQGRITMTDLGVWRDDHVEGLYSITKLTKKWGAKVGIQLAHAGRKAVVDGPIMAPSPIKYKDDMKDLEVMSIEGIKRTVNEFKQAARRSREAGFDVIEIHAAHGYLINQFLSPLSNERTDVYGGSRENRFRFLKEIIENIKTEWDGPLFVRISAEEYHPEGNQMEDFVYYSKKMKDLGVDLIDCSSGAIVRARIDVYPGYQVPLADEIKEKANIPTGAVGLITDALHAEEVLKNNRADLIFIGREFLRNPYWPLDAAIKLGVSIESIKQYEKAWKEVIPKSKDGIQHRWYPGKEQI